MAISTSKRRKQRDAFTEINITPLTDIFLVLLIIMMVIAPMLDQQGLSLMVPSEHEATKQEKKLKIITIDVSAEGAYTLDGSTITPNELLTSLKTAFETKKDGLLIKADEDSSHGVVVTVMDAAQTAGIKNVSLMEK